MSNPRIVYIPRPDATPEVELDALTTVYAHALQKYQERKMAGEHTPMLAGSDNAEDLEHGRTAT